MNIFALDDDPVEAARLHKNTHVVKMILETAQILCTVHHRYDCPAPYKPTHQHHPCTLWAGQNTGNYAWLVQLGLALCAEYTRRYDKTHKCQALIEQLTQPPAALPQAERTAFALAMPEELKDYFDPVGAYRRYYELHKGHLK